MKASPPNNSSSQLKSVQSSLAFCPQQWSGKELHFQPKYAQLHHQTSFQPSTPQGFPVRQPGESLVQFLGPATGSHVDANFTTFASGLQMCPPGEMNFASFVAANQARPFVPTQGMRAGATAPVSTTKNSVPFSAGGLSPLVGVSNFSPAASSSNPFQTMNLNQSQGFVPLHHQMLSPVKPIARQVTADHLPQEGCFVGEQLSNKSFVERSMFKRELCKNWTETGFCRYGVKCQYAHGLEELSEQHQLYLNEQKQGQNDKYKSQNCRQFYREKMCPYGKRCHFRHEYRSFKKIHRHFYMAHLAALSLTSQDMLSDSKIAPDGRLQPAEAILDTSTSELSFRSAKKTGLRKEQSCDLSTDDEGCLEQQEPEFAPIIPNQVRLPIFQSICQQGEAKAHPSSSGVGSSFEDAQPHDFEEETWSQTSIEQLLV